MIFLQSRFQHKEKRIFKNPIDSGLKNFDARFSMPLYKLHLDRILDL